MDSDRARQIARDTQHVQGWLTRDAVMLFAALDELQALAGIRGDLFEIGVHHGRSAVMLARMARSGESLGLCDLFASQAENVSESGMGDRAIVERNLAKYVPQPPAIRICEKNSKNLTPDEVGEGIRLFHIDGGHNPDEALSDLRLAARSLGEQGAIVVDDPFRYDWPGVTEAIVRFLQTEPDFCSLITAFNKLVITRCTAAETYAAIREPDFRARYRLDKRFVFREMPFMGGAIFVLADRTKSVKRTLVAFRERHAFFNTPYVRPFVRLAGIVTRSWR